MALTVVGAIKREDGTQEREREREDQNLNWEAEDALRSVLVMLGRFYAFLGSSFVHFQFAIRISFSQKERRVVKHKCRVSG